jgi:membrane protein YdbS with pleckstrin-like domain
VSHDPSREALPSVADDVERALHPASLTLSRISAGIAATVLGLASLIALGVVQVASSMPAPVGILALTGWLVLVGLLAVWSIGWPVLAYRRTSYRVDEQGIQIRRGVLWRTVSSVPRSRVQHTDVSQGPLERSFGLATLIVHTAGTHNASVSLGGLEHQVALRIRDHLIEGGEGDAV